MKIKKAQLDRIKLEERIADLLAATRERLEKKGWWRGSLVGPNGQQRCVIGAMDYVLGIENYRTQMPERDTELRKATNDLIMSLVERPRLSLPLRGKESRLRTPTALEDWNDWFAKDKQEILDTLAKAEKIARAGYDPDA